MKGTIVGLVGRNGSGKTMLLKSICGIVPPTSGQILVRGKEIGKDIDVPDNIGVIIETPGFLLNYTGFQNLKYLSMIRNKITKNQILEALKIVGLDQQRNKKAGKYSLGMQQRLGIAQAIMEHPDILLLDEPMNGLDNQGVEEIRTLLLKLKEEGTTILLASHSREDISILCDEVFELDHGSILKKVIVSSEL